MRNHAAWVEAGLSLGQRRWGGGRRVPSIGSSSELQLTLTTLQAVFGINFLRFDARSRLCAPRLGTGFAATVSRTPSPRMVEGPINSFHRQVARRPRNAETTESTADEP